MSASGAPQRRRLLRELTVQGWFRMVFAVLGVLVVLAAVLVAALTVQTRETSNELTGSILPAQAQAYRLQGALVDQETGVRGYGLTGDLRFLQPYTTGRAAEQAAAARLRALVGGKPPLIRDLARIERAAAGLADRLRDPIHRAGPARPAERQPTWPSWTGASTPSTGSGCCSPPRTPTWRRRGQPTRRGWAGPASSRTGSTRPSWPSSCSRRRRWRSCWTGRLRRLHSLREASELVAEGDYSHHIQPAGPADLGRGRGRRRDAQRAGLSPGDSRAAQAVAARQAADLDSQAAELRRSNAELEQFAYVASHDLQEPLRKVASFCQLLEKRYSDKLDERGVKYIEFAVDGAKRMQILINDLLTFSRVGRASDVRVPVPLDQPLDAALTALSAAIEETGAVIERPGRCRRSWATRRCSACCGRTWSATPSSSGPRTARR